MTIDEAIKNHKKYEELANERKKGVRNQDVVKMQTELALYHSQIAEWLEELKAYKESLALKKEYYQGRSDATNEIHTELSTEIALLNETKMTDVDLYTFAVRIKEITDKLKEQK